MAWIEAHQELLSHPKTLRLTKLMGWNIDLTIAKMLRFWWWCMDYAPDGDLRTRYPSDIGAAVGLSDAEAKKFVSALVKARWLDREPYFRVHNWWRYTGLFLQRKHSRHPHVWQQVRDSYVPPSTTSTIELDESCCALQKTQRTECSTSPTAQPIPCSITTAVQQEALSSPPSEHPVSCSSTPAVQQEECSSTPTVQPGSCSCTPPNLTIPNPTKPDITKKNNQQQQQPAAFQSYPHSANPGRQQQQPPPNPPLATGAVADTVGLGDCSYRLPVCASPENDLKRILYDRIGRKVRLSLLDLNKIINLKNKHGPDFFNACDFLHGGVKNPAAFLLAILEPESETEKLAERLRKRALTQATMSKEHPD